MITLYDHIRSCEPSYAAAASRAASALRCGPNSHEPSPSKPSSNMRSTSRSRRCTRRRPPGRVSGLSLAPRSYTIGQTWRRACGRASPCLRLHG
jgi:hypothetical protein